MGCNSRTWQPIQILLLVKRIIEHCFKAGAKEVYVFDHTCDNWVNCYRNSGIEKAAKSAGAKVVPANSESYYQEIEIPGRNKTSKSQGPSAVA